jgi:hypothetical protein
MVDTISALRAVRIGTDFQVGTIIANHLILTVADHICTSAPGLFSRVYYNSPIVPALNAQSDNALVWIYTAICGTALCKTCRATGKKLPSCDNGLCDQPWPGIELLRGLTDLKNHRDVVSHPFTHQLDRRGVRAFIEERRDSEDLRPALVWDVHRSINDALRGLGSPEPELCVTIHDDTCGTLECLLSLCLRKEVQPIGLVALREWLEDAWRVSKPHLEAHPDGRLPKKTSEDYDKIFKTWIKRWEETH